MAGERKQLNFRVDADTEVRVSRAQDAVAASLGTPVSVADLFRMGLAEIEKKYGILPANTAKKNSRKSAASRAE